MEKKTLVLVITIILVISTLVYAVGSQGASTKTRHSFDRDILNQAKKSPDALPSAAGDSWWNTGWQYRKNITINHTKIDTDLTNFPVLINIVDADLANDAQDNFYDIVFTDDLGNQLNHEIEFYDSSNGHLVAWVNISSLSSSADTLLYLYYGNPSCDNQENIDDVWDAHFMMVQHLEEYGTTTRIDSTANSNDAVTGRYFYALADREWVMQAHSSGRAHTLSVVKANKDGHTYWGYVGPVDSGSIDLHFSDDLEGWTAYGSNPIISGNGVRWPGVLLVDDTFWMVHTVDYDDSYVVLKNSDDGINFSKVGDMTGWGYQNPSLFHDTLTGMFYFLAYQKSPASIIIRESNTVTGLLAADDVVILDTSDVPGDTIAAPYMFYRDGYYWILVETLPAGLWNNEVFYSDSPLGPFIRAGNSPIHTDDEACPFPYIENDIMYLYVCHRCSGQGWGIRLYTSDFSIEQGGYLSGVIDGADMFDGDNYLTAPDAGSLEITAPATVSFWFKTTQGGNRVLLEKNGNDGFSVQRDYDNTMKMNVGGSSGSEIRTSGNNYNDGVWHHIAFVLKSPGSSSSVFVDGINVTAASPDPGVPSYGSESLFIGSRSGDYGFNGIFDEIRISDTARSAGWIVTTYNNQLGTDAFYSVGEEQQQPGFGTTDNEDDNHCIIIAASYGSSMGLYVKVLREFRDRFLLTNGIGNAIVNLYYTYSPPIADFIAIHDALKAIARWSLLPIFGVGWLVLELGLMPVLLFVFLPLALLSAYSMSFCKRSRFTAL